MSSDGIDKTNLTAEYYLLYHGEWYTEEAASDVLPKLTYCVSLGELPGTAAETIAVEYRINYCDQSGSWREFKGFCYEDGTHNPFYEMWMRRSIPDRLAAACSGAKVAFDKEYKSDTTDGAIDFIRKIIRAAYDVRGEQPPSIESITSGVSTDDIRIAVYETAIHEGLVMADDVKEVDRWHILSKRKYKGKGWADIADMVEKEAVRKGSKPRTGKQMDALARTIQNRVEAHRANLEQGKDTNTEQ